VTPCVAVVVFPGSNCEFDVVEAIRHLGGDAQLVWHGETSLSGVDAIVLPGGFAHGDYLRPGAIARFSPVMQAVHRFAADGGPVVGICNGFQILCEASLLPGALQKNRDLKFLCTPTRLRVDSIGTPLTDESEVDLGAELTVPINHFEGSYVCSDETLRELREDGRVVLRYLDNPNGSIDDIAGICSRERNVVGLMPHPERATHPLLGSTDGAPLLRSLLAAATSSVALAPS
jgi:phosphoribosylformylglycinamidine synthase subunit PurQ / glutaminase